MGEVLYINQMNEVKLENISKRDRKLLTKVIIKFGLQYIKEVIKIAKIGRVTYPLEFINLIYYSKRTNSYKSFGGKFKCLQSAY